MPARLRSLSRRFDFCTALPSNGGGISSTRSCRALKKPRRTLPIILSPEEVVHFLGCVANVKQRDHLWTTCYAAGLRISEAVHP